ncbi:MAG: CDP-alcohol phosphatidyltransferase family protein [Patescibacteria group bacterium]
MIKLAKRLFELKELYLQKLSGNFPNWISPNLVTVVRGLLAWPIIYFLLKENYLVAVILLIPAFLLDALDGPLARVKNKVTFFGKLADPVADKILFVPVVIIVGLQLLPHYLVWAVVGLEMILIMNVFILKGLGEILKVNFLPGANMFGKIKFTVQIIGSILLLISVYSEALILPTIIVFWLAVGLALCSIVKHALTFEPKMK